MSSRAPYVISIRHATADRCPRRLVGSGAAGQCGGDPPLPGGTEVDKLLRRQIREFGRCRMPQGAAISLAAQICCGSTSVCASGELLRWRREPARRRSAMSVGVRADVGRVPKRRFLIGPVSALVLALLAGMSWRPGGAGPARDTFMQADREGAGVVR